MTRTPSYTVRYGHTALATKQVFNPHLSDHAHRVSGTKFADLDTRPATRGSVRTNTAATTTRIRRKMGTQHGRSRTRAAAMQSVCGLASEHARKGFHGRKTSVSLSDTNGTNAGEIKIPLERPVLDSGSGKWHVSTGYASRRRTTPESEWVSTETVLRTHATKAVPRRKIRALTIEAHMYYSVTLNVVPYHYL